MTVESRTLSVGGRERRYLLYRPPVPASPAPVVLMLHGAGATAELALGNTGWAAQADAAGFLAVFPEGTPRDPSRPPAFLQNPQTWNDGSGRGHVARDGVDDVAFLAAILDELVSRDGADADHLHLTGFSNGASLAFRAAAELGDRVASLAPVAGHLWLERPAPSRPVSLLALFGGADPLNPVEGGEIRTPWGSTEYHPPVAGSAERWAAAIGCAGPATAETVSDSDGVRTFRWASCGDGTEVVLRIVDELGHVWPGGRRLLPERVIGRPSDRLRGAEVIWEFFRRHPRQPAARL